MSGMWKLSTAMKIEPAVLKEIPPLIMRIHSTMYDYKLKTVQYEKKDLARPQHRTIMLFITSSLIGICQTSNTQVL